MVTAALAGDFGKPRPALIVQDDEFSDLPSLIVCPLTTTVRPEAAPFRITIDPTDANGLRQPSQVSVDKTTALLKTRIGSVIGQADDDTMARVDRALARFLGLA